MAVLGIGGIGGMLAVRTGAVCVGTERTVDAIRANGLTLVDGESTSVAHPEAVATLDRPVSLLVVAVKAYALDAALDRIDPDALGNAVVLPLLNGLEHVDTIRERFAAVVAAGSIGRVEAYSPEPGFVVQRTPGALITAASRDLGRAALETRLALLAGPRFDVVVADDERSVLWEKAARLAVLAAATVASGRTVGELRDDADWRQRLLAGLEEGVAVAAQDGVALTADDQWAIIEAMPAELITSTARDAAVGRPTELDAITGGVIRAGLRLGIETPTLDALFEEARCRAPSR